MLNLMYITKHPEIARIAEEAGVDWIFVGYGIHRKGLPARRA